MSSSTSKKSSYSAFSEVDALVSKPVLGSDGAASWQDFKSTQNKSSNLNSSSSLPSVSPALPTKRADKLGTGFQNLAEERAHEERIRREGGEKGVGSGYTHFRRKNDAEELARKKRIKLIEDRVRPDDKRYFISASTFDGWKKDYVFTTRHRGTGYYWDGMDSVKKLMGAGKESDYGNEQVGKDAEDTQGGDDERKKKKKKKKKKKEKHTGSNSIVAEEEISNNPMDQVANALRRRNELMSQPPGVLGVKALAAVETAALTGTIGNALTSGAVSSSSALTNANMDEACAELAKHGWEKAVDPASGKEYFFCRSTGERRWDSPLQASKNDVTDSVKDQSQKHPEGEESSLPTGWSSANDPNSGKVYYYNASLGKTSWDRPTS